MFGLSFSVSASLRRKVRRTLYDLCSPRFYARSGGEVDEEDKETPCY